jgi:hypothetical protein
MQATSKQRMTQRGAKNNKNIIFVKAQEPSWGFLEKELTKKYEEGECLRPPSLKPLCRI